MPFFSIRNRIFKEHFTREAPFFLFFFSSSSQLPRADVEIGAQRQKQQPTHQKRKKEKEKMHENNDETDVEGPLLCTYTYLLAQNNSKIKKNIKTLYVSHQFVLF